jgi:hypothetical protein
MPHGGCRFREHSFRYHNTNGRSYGRKCIVMCFKKPFPQPNCTNIVVELALDSMTERDSDRRSYGILQGSTTAKSGSKIESQSGKAKGRKATSGGVNPADTNGVKKVRFDGLTTYPSPLSLTIQSRSREETTSKDGDTDVSTSDNSPLSWTIVQQKRKTRRIGRVKGLTLQGVT